MIKIKQSKNGELEIGINEYHVFIDQDGNCCPIFIDFDNIDKLIEALRLVPVEPPEDMDIKICRLVDHRIDVFEADRIYKAMIGAAP